MNFFDAWPRQHGLPSGIVQTRLDFGITMFYFYSDRGGRAVVYTDDHFRSLYNIGDPIILQRHIEERIANQAMQNHILSRLETINAR